MLRYSFTNSTYLPSFSDSAIATERKPSIIRAFSAKIQQLNDNDQIGTAATYQNTVHSLISFAGKDFEYQTITVEWLKCYEKYMRNAGKSFTTIGIYLRNLRAIFNDAIKKGYVSSSAYPFGLNKDGKYEIPQSESRKMALSAIQMKKIFSFTNNNATIMRYVDLWKFSYLCNGANINDVLRFKYGNIQGEELFFLRGKTSRTAKKKREVAVFITPEMQKIIDKWGNIDKSSNNYIFPYLAKIVGEQQTKSVIADITKRINKYMKQVSKLLGLPAITTYTARHSFATILKRGGANIAYIAESLGHSDLKTTANYLASFETEERRRNAMLLTNFNAVY